jgi:two-component system nitrate/nitrite response regulator NarL
VRVVVGDDHRWFRDGVVRALASSGAVEVVATRTVPQAINHLPDHAILFGAHNPDVCGVLGR